MFKLDDGILSIFFISVQKHATKTEKYFIVTEYHIFTSSKEFKVDFSSKQKVQIDI